MRRGDSRAAATGTVPFPVKSARTGSARGLLLALSGLEQFVCSTKEIFRGPRVRVAIAAGVEGQQLAATMLTDYVLTEIIHADLKSSTARGALLSEVG